MRRPSTPLGTVLGRQVRQPRVGQDAADQKLHNLENRQAKPRGRRADVSARTPPSYVGGRHARPYVERRADDGGVLAEAVDRRDGEVDCLERLEHLVLALDHVRRRDELADRLLAEHVAAAGAVHQQERRVGLADLELPHGQRRREARHMGDCVALQRGHVKGVAAVANAAGRQPAGDLDRVSHQRAERTHARRRCSAYPCRTSVVSCPTPAIVDVAGRRLCAPLGSASSLLRELRRWFNPSLLSSL